ncbi:MAG: hypothetical protein V1804_01825 [Patescibacteria group bacterium]
MWSLIKFIIWLAGLAVVAYFVLNYFGYEPNRDYFKESRTECQKRLSDCQSELIHKGTDGAQCDFNCVNPKLIIKKK